MAAITLSNLSRTFRDGTAAVRDVSLQIPDRKITVIVGPSGCGKTTTLRLIAGLERSDGGDIRINDQSVLRDQPAERGVALVGQSMSLYPHLTVRNNLRFALQTNRTPRSEWDDRIESAKRVTNLDSLRFKMPGELSAGERQRAALARALVRRPSILLLDEPLSNLDPTSRRDMQDLIRSLPDEFGMTIVHVTHDQEEALALADQLAVMRDGVILQCDEPHRVFDKPHDTFAAQYIGHPPMNLLRGRIEPADGTLRFVEHDLEHGAPVNAITAPRNASLGEVTLGVRPQVFRTDDSATETHQIVLNAEYARSDRIGSRVDMICRTASSDRVIVSCNESAESYSPSDKLRLAVRPEDLHWFGADNRRLTAE